MQTSKSLSRRNFIEKATVTAGLTALGTQTLFGKSNEFSPAQVSLPREVWIATVSQEGMSADTCENMVDQILALLDKKTGHRPDVICLPEYVMVNRVRQRIRTLDERVNISDELLKKFDNYARANRCYMIVPAFIKEDGKIYNAAVVIDRNGNRMGEYRKMHLPEDEVQAGYAHGQLNPPVFKTDFGTIGIQICYDCNWHDGWKALQEQGAEIVFWPSAFPGGRMINAKAWDYKYIVVTSTWGRSKICDIVGDEIAATGNWEKNYICVPVNLEQAFSTTWPYSRQFDEIIAKYGRKIKITAYHDENWAIFESLSPDVRVNDVLNEFNIKTAAQTLQDSELDEQKMRQ